MDDNYDMIGMYLHDMILWMIITYIIYIYMYIPFGKPTLAWKILFFCLGKSTVSMAIYSKLLVYPVYRANSYQSPGSIPSKSPKIPGIPVQSRGMPGLWTLGQWQNHHQRGEAAKNSAGNGGDSAPFYYATMFMGKV